jgi:hypothetical protein
MWGGPMKKLLTIITVVLLIAVVSVSTGAQSQFNPSESDFDFTLSRSMDGNAMKEVDETFTINYSIKPKDIVPLNNSSEVSGLKPIGITDRGFAMNNEYRFDSTVTIDFPETKNGKPSFQNLMMTGVKDTYTINGLNNLPNKLGPWSGSHGNGRTKWVESSVEALKNAGLNENVKIPVVEIDGNKNHREYEFLGIALFDLYLKNGEVWGKFKGYYLKDGLTHPESFLSNEKLIFTETFPSGLDVDTTYNTASKQQNSNGQTVVTIDFGNPAYTYNRLKKRYEAMEIIFSIPVTPKVRDKSFDLRNAKLSYGSRNFPFPEINFSTFDVGLTVYPSRLTMTEGEEFPLSNFIVNIEDPSGRNKNYKWHLGTGEDAIKLENNKIIALKPVEYTTLYVVADPDSSTRSQIQITVVKRMYPLTDLSFKKENYPIKEGTSVHMLEELIFNPGNATNKEVEWISDNEEMLQVDKETGLITAVSKGHVQLMAISKENPKIVAITNIVVQHNPNDNEVEGTDDYRW